MTSWGSILKIIEKKSNEENIRREESSLYKCNIFQRLTVKPNDDDE